MWKNLVYKTSNSWFWIFTARRVAWTSRLSCQLRSLLTAKRKRWATRWPPADPAGWRRFDRRSPSAGKLHILSSTHKRLKETETRWLAERWGNESSRISASRASLPWAQSPRWRQKWRHNRRNRVPAGEGDKCEWWLCSFASVWVCCPGPCESYYVSERVGFDRILSSQWDAAEDDEDEDEVGEVGMMDEVVACNSQTGNRTEREGGLILQYPDEKRAEIILAACLISHHQFFFPRMKKELPSGIGTIFSFGPENSGFNGATPVKKQNKKQPTNK